MKPLTRQKLNTVIDIIMFVVMIALTAIGLLIKYILVPGHERWAQYGQNVKMSFMGLDRHEWGYIHYILGIILVALLVLHIVFHWKQLVCLIKRLIPKKTVRYIIVSFLIIVCCSFVFIPLIFSPKLNAPLYRNSLEYRSSKILPNIKKNDINEEIREIKKDYSVQSKLGKREVKKNNKQNRGLNIKGYNTIADLASIYNVSSSEIKKKLKIPLSVSDNERLGHLRKRYGFSMHEVEECILNLKK